jgi:serine/threonine protein kinase
LNSGVSTEMRVGVPDDERTARGRAWLATSCMRMAAMALTRRALACPNAQSALEAPHFKRIDQRPKCKRSGKSSHEQLPYPGSTLMDEQDMRCMLRALVLSIKHMAARGYLHCDLKPDNVLFDFAPDGSKVFRVCDFNLATRMGSDGRIPRAPGGTPGYRSWETHCQREGIEQPHPISIASDIASAGLILASATGLHCFGFGATQAYLEYERDLPRRTPPALKELIEWMVAVDPSERPSPDQVLAHRWMAAEQ